MSLRKVRLPRGVPGSLAGSVVLDVAVNLVERLGRVSDLWVLSLEQPVADALDDRWPLP